MEKPPVKPSFFEYYIKPVVRPFFILWIIFFFIINFNNVIWIFNKKALEQSIKDRTKDLVVTVEEEPNLPPPDLGTMITGDAYLTIPKLDFHKQIIFPESSEPEAIDEALMGTVMHFPDSAFPGESGNVTLLAHSAPITWGPSYRVFNEIDELEEGDTFTIQFNNKVYRYIILNRYLVSPGEHLPDNENQKKAYLLTCWPPDSGYQRMVVEAKQID